MLSCYLMLTLLTNFAFAAPLVWYNHNNNHVIGTLSRSRGSDESLLTFPSYKLHFDNTKKFFSKKNGDLISYNPNYEPARQFFSDSLPGRIARAAARWTSKWMFTTRPWHEPKYIDNGNDFLQLINHGRRDNCVILYDFVLTDSGTFRMAPVFAHNIVSEMAGKHATLSSANKRVFFAGDFVVGNDDVLYISNNSGTYAPDFKNIDRLATLLMYELPGLRVEPINFTDPEYKTIFGPAERDSRDCFAGEILSSFQSFHL